MTWTCPQCSFTTTCDEPHKSREVLNHLYRQHQLSQYQIGRLLAVHRSTVQVYLCRFGIPLRSYSQAARLRWQHTPLSAKSRAAISEADAQQHFTIARKRRMSRSLVAYHRGCRILANLAAEESSLSLCSVHPTAIGRAWMDGDCRWATQEFWPRLKLKLLRDGFDRGQLRAAEIACTKLLGLIIFQEVA